VKREQGLYTLRKSGARGQKADGQGTDRCKNNQGLSVGIILRTEDPREGSAQVGRGELRRFENDRSSRLA